MHAELPVLGENPDLQEAQVPVTSQKLQLSILQSTQVPKGELMLGRNPGLHPVQVPLARHCPVAQKGSPPPVH